MADSKISALTAASAAAAANEFAINESGTSKKVTAAQIKTLITTAPYYAYIRQHADGAVFANDTNFRAVFDSVAAGTLTIEVGTYKFEGLIQCKGMSGTSGNMKWDLLGAGGATLTNHLQLILGIDGAMNTNAAAGGVPLITAASSVNITSAATSVNCTIRVFGTFECTVAGTVIPSIAQSTAVNGTAQITAGSYLHFTKLGATTDVSAGSWA